MRKVFWENPYQSELNTVVDSVDGDCVLFRDTIAYSFTGGQESDEGTVNGIDILGSRIEGSLIYYTLPGNHGLRAGDSVLMVINWPRRYRIMRLHFAAELILELVTRFYHFEKVGAHISELKSRIDFISDENISGKFPTLLEHYNGIIEKDLPIRTGFSDIATQRRYWEIDGFSKVACGGTHVKSTAEVGGIALKRSHPGKSIERVEIRLVGRD